jgi:uncharacterized protein (TIGR02453 family)
MVGLPCLRVHGAFFASCDRRSGDLLVKLPAARVDQLVGSGRAHAFAPAGRRFREWAAVPPERSRSWRQLLDEALAFRGRRPLMAPPRFAFPTETLAFLADLRAYNTKPWFDAHRHRYEAAYLEPAKAFVETIAPALEDLVPGIATEPRVNGSIFRIKRDTRFSKDKTPYKDHLDFWFWAGDRRTALSGLFLRIAPDAVIVGAGAHGFDPPRLARYRAAVADSGAGRELAATVTRLERRGHEVGDETYTRTPRGFTADGDRERLLRHSALYAHAQLPTQLATDPTLVPTLLRHWHAFAPLHAWLVTHVQ